MSCCRVPVAQDVRPGTARVVVTELSGSGFVNPTPATKKTCEDLDTAAELYLSPERLVSFQKCLRIQHHPTDILSFVFFSIHVVSLCA